MPCSWFEAKSIAFTIYEYCKVWILFVYYWDYQLDSSFYMNIGSFKQFYFLSDKTELFYSKYANRQTDVQGL